MDIGQSPYLIHHLFSKLNLTGGKPLRHRLFRYKLYINGQFVVLSRDNVPLKGQSNNKVGATLIGA
jgi:hypothetical protein